MTEKQFEVQYDGWRYFHVADTINERCIARLDTKGDADAFLEIIKEYEELVQENEQLKQENKKILDTINNKITEKGMDWYKAEDNSKEEKEANLQLNVLEEKINKFIEDEVDGVLDVQFIEGERFFGLAYKYDGGLLVFDKTQQIIADWDWWDVIPMTDEQVIQLLNDLYTECESLKSKNKQLI